MAAIMAACATVSLLTGLPKYASAAAPKPYMLTPVGTVFM